MFVLCHMHSGIPPNSHVLKFVTIPSLAFPFLFRFPYSFLCISGLYPRHKDVLGVTTPLLACFCVGVKIPTTGTFCASSALDHPSLPSPSLVALQQPLPAPLWPSNSLFFLPPILLHLLPHCGPPFSPHFSFCFASFLFVGNKSLA